MIENRNMQEAPRPEQQTFYNLSREELVNHALELGRYQAGRVNIRNSEGELVQGPLRIETEKQKRSAQDKYYVKTPATEGRVWEEINKPLDSKDHSLLHEDLSNYLGTQDRYIVDVALCADENSPMRKTFRFTTSSPAHALFIKNLYRELTPEEQEATKDPNYRPDYSILHAPEFKANEKRHNTRSDTVIAADYENGTGIIVGTDYLGELKKFGFTIMHWAAVEESNEDVQFAIIHGSAFELPDGNVVIFQGPSGAGKSSALVPEAGKNSDEKFTKLADDEIIVAVYADGTVKTVQIEGGAYLTTSNAFDEQDVKEAAEMPLSIMENNAITEDTREVIWNSDKYKNPRAGVDESDLHYKKSGISGKIRYMVSLDPDFWGDTDPSGVVPNRERALLNLLMGLGAKRADRESGVKGDVQREAIPWSDEPFLVFPPEDSLDTFELVFEASDTTFIRLNTGIIGGPDGIGRRPKVTTTQAGGRAVINHEFTDESLGEPDPIFGWRVPKEDSKLDDRLKPSANTWEDEGKHQESKVHLAKWMRQEFFKRYGKSTHPRIEELAKLLPNVPEDEPETTGGTVIFTS